MGHIACGNIGSHRIEGSADSLTGLLSRLPDHRCDLSFLLSSLRGRSKRSAAIHHHFPALHLPAIARVFVALRGLAYSRVAARPGPVLVFPGDSSGGLLLSAKPSA